MNENVPHVIRDDHDRHSGYKPVSHAQDRLDSAYLGYDDRLSLSFVVEGIIEEDLVLFVPFKAPAVNVQERSGGDKYPPNRPHHWHKGHHSPPGKAQLPAYREPRPYLAKHNSSDWMRLDISFLRAFWSVSTIAPVNYATRT